MDIIKKALQSPVRQIVANAGVDGSVVVGKLLEGKKPTQGYDAQNETYCDMSLKELLIRLKSFELHWKMQHPSPDCC